MSGSMRPRDSPLVAPVIHDGRAEEDMADFDRVYFYIYNIESFG